MLAGRFALSHIMLYILGEIPYVPTMAVSLCRRWRPQTASAGPVSIGSESATKIGLHLGTNEDADSGPKPTYRQGRYFGCRVETDGRG